VNGIIGGGIVRLFGGTFLGVKIGVFFGVIIGVMSGVVSGVISGIMTGVISGVVSGVSDGLKIGMGIGITEGGSGLTGSGTVIDQSSVRGGTGITFIGVNPSFCFPCCVVDSSGIVFGDCRGESFG
jgi:hypothetical protein